MPNTGRGPISSRSVSTTYSSAAGSPGPLARKTASGPFATTSAAVAPHGCSSTVAPRCTRLRTIEDLMPVSIAAMRMSPSPTVAISRGDTSRARSRPVMEGSAAISAPASASLIRPGNTPPRIAPADRVWRPPGGGAEPRQGGLGGDQRPRLGLAHPPGEHAPAHRAGRPDVAHQSARVDAGDRRHAAIGEPVEPAALGAGRVLGVRRGAHDRRTRPDAVGLHRVRARAVVADVRVGERDELAGERRVGHRLLVAAHAGREDDLAGGVDVSAARLAVEARAVLEEDVGAQAPTATRARSR